MGSRPQIIKENEAKMEQRTTDIRRRRRSNLNAPILEGEREGQTTTSGIDKNLSEALEKDNLVAYKPDGLSSETENRLSIRATTKYPTTRILLYSPYNSEKIAYPPEDLSTKLTKSDFCEISQTDGPRTSERRSLVFSY
jgi:hypothetical protein